MSKKILQVEEPPESLGVRLERETESEIDLLALSLFLGRKATRVSWAEVRKTIRV